jgi:hypothetical protein
MSEPTQSSTNPPSDKLSDSKEASKVPAPKEAAKKPRHLWKKRVVRFFMGAVSIVLLAQIALSFMLPWTLRRVARLYELDFECDRTDLNLFNSDAGLWHVKLTHAKDGLPIASADYCRLDLSILNLMIGRLKIQRLETDGVDLTVQRNADGSIPLLESLAFGIKQQGTNPVVAPARPATQPGSAPALDLRPPIGIDAFRLTHVKAHLIDNFVSPPLDTRILFNLRLTDVASTAQPTKFAFELLPSPQGNALMDSLVIEAASKKVNDAKSLDASFQLSARGLHPKLLAGYLAPLGIGVTADGMAASANGSISISVIPDRPQFVTGSISLTKLDATADNEPAASLQSVSIDIAAAGTESVDLKAITIQDGLLLGERMPDGRARLAGLELSPETRKPSNTRTTPSTSQMKWSLGELAFKNLQASFKDLAVTPVTNLKFAVNKLSMTDFVSDPAKPNQSVKIHGNCSAPGIIGDIALKGSCTPFAVNKKLDLKVNATGIRPDALQPYLTAANIESDLKAGAFTCDVSADLSAPDEDHLDADARFYNIRFTDDKELLALDEFKISHIGTGPGTVHLGTIEVTGPRAEFRRDKSGAILAAGFRLKPAPANFKPAMPVPLAATTGPSTNPATTTPPFDFLATLPKLDIGKFQWSGVHLQFDDDATPGDKPTSFTLEDVAVEVTSVHLDLDPKAPPGKPGHIHATFKAPGIVGGIELDGTLLPRRGGMAADLVIDGKELSTVLVGPYCKAFNVEPTLSQGTIHSKAHVDFHRVRDVLTGSVWAEDFKLTSPEGEMLGADKAAITGIHLEPGALEINQVVLERPRGTVLRDQSGGFNAIGWRLLPPKPVEKNSDFVAVAQQGSEPVKRPEVATPSAPFVLSLKKLTVHDGALTWSDRTVTPVANTAFRVTGELTGLVLGKPADPAHLDFSLGADGILDEFKLAGVASIDAQSAAATLDMTAKGIREGALVSYLPAGGAIDLKDGRFRAHVQTSVTTMAEGQLSGQLAISDVDYRDNGDAEPLFGLDSVHIAVPLVDLREDATRQIVIDDISVSGVQARARKSHDGAIHLLGLSVASVPATQPTTGPAIQPTTEASDDVPLDDVSPAAGPLVIARKIYPLVTIKKFGVNVRQLTFTDESRANIPPVIVNDLSLIAKKPIVQLGKRAETEAPAEFDLSLKIHDLLDSFAADVKVAPFAAQPTLSVDVTGTGLHGAGLLDQAPELKSQIDASSLKDGRFRGNFFTRLKIDRFDPLDFPMSHAFHADGLFKALEFRAAKDGPVLAGVGEIRSDDLYVRPDKSIVQLKSLEISDIAGQAVRDTDGLHALGLIVKIPDQTATAHSTPGAPSARPTAQPSAFKGEIRIGKLLVSGIDFRAEDRTVTPPLIIPINELEADFRNLDSVALTRKRPATKFNILIGAGKVPLPKKGAAGTEDRDLFSDVGVIGELTTYPAVKGWIKTSVDAFDLASLTATIQKRGFNVANGIFDSEIDARLPGDHTMKVTSQFDFTDLDMSEPENGPIKQTLKLPLPLNGLIGLLEDADGSIDVPLDVTVKHGTLAGDEIAKAAIEAFRVVVDRAIKAAPMKIIESLDPALNDKKHQREEPITLTFAAGDDAIFSSDAAKLTALLKRLNSEPELEISLTANLTGGPQAASNDLTKMTGDVARAAARANPTAEECRELINSMTRRANDLTRSRLDLLGQARSDAASGSKARTAQSIEALRGVARDLAACNSAVDALYELQRPGAEKQAGRRTKKAALAIAKARQESIQAFLKAGGMQHILTRVKLIHPQFHPAPGDDAAGGTVTITLTVKKPAESK